MQDQETISQLLEGVRRFVNERLIPLEAKVSEEDAIPADAMALDDAIFVPPPPDEMNRALSDLDGVWKAHVARYGGTPFAVAARRALSILPSTSGSRTRR